jgi:hypothetical protein
MKKRKLSIRAVLARLGVLCGEMKVQILAALVRLEEI